MQSLHDPSASTESASSRRMQITIYGNMEIAVVNIKPHSVKNLPSYKPAKGQIWVQKTLIEVIPLEI